MGVVLSLSVSLREIEIAPHYLQKLAHFPSKCCRNERRLSALAYWTGNSYRQSFSTLEPCEEEVILRVNMAAKWRQ